MLCTQVLCSGHCGFGPFCFQVLLACNVWRRPLAPAATQGQAFVMRLHLAREAGCWSELSNKFEWDFVPESFLKHKNHRQTSFQASSISDLQSKRDFWNEQDVNDLRPNKAFVHSHIEH